MSEFEYDVFISYSSKDKAWVRGELLSRIEGAGLRAFIDFRDFDPGAPSIDECERGVVICRKTLVVLTPNYVASEWTEIESIMAQTLGPANRDRRLVPLLKAECEISKRLSALSHIDFRDGADQELAWQKLLKALGASRRSPPVLTKSPAPPPGWFLENPYPMPPHFTGRVAERKVLSQWLNTDADHPLLSLRALGGFGKSALVWHWLTHDVDVAAWPRVVWWSFYEAEASFEDFLTRTLEYLTSGSLDPKKLAPKDQVRALLHLLRSPGVLLVLDGFERALRAFSGLGAAYQGDDEQLEANGRECVSPLGDWFLQNLAVLPHFRSNALITTRLCPRVLEAKGGGLLQGCRELELRQMDAEDAADFFLAQKVRGTRTEIKTACERYGYHPLSLRLLAGVIVGDLRQPGDIAAAVRLDVSGDLVQRQHHVLQVAYDRLTPTRRTLLGRIACFRSSMKYEALEALTNEDAVASASLDADLRDLVSRGLLHHNTEENRFDLHPIVRRYAYDRLAAPDRTAVHSGLRDYFAAIPTPDRVTRLEDLFPVIELYHHTLRAGQFDEAYELFRDRLASVLYFQLGAYQIRIELLRGLFPDGEDRTPRLESEKARASTLNVLANSYSLCGQPRRSSSLMERYISLSEQRGDLRAVAIGLGNISDDQLKIGMLRTAEFNLRRYVELSKQLGIEEENIDAHAELGRVLAYRGDWNEADAELRISLDVFERNHELQGQVVVLGYCALLNLLKSRDRSVNNFSPSGALEQAKRCVELAERQARAGYPIPRDLVRAYWLLGAAHRLSDNHADSERCLSEALQRCRRINSVDVEADILIDLARLNAATDQRITACQLAEEAISIADRCGFALQAADAHLELAKVAASNGDQPAANRHAQEACRLATCDGLPDHTYKVAYDESVALLKISDER